ncbi:DMT family transporter [Intestinibaculum porci]|uniref:DMT family transporter n=1 Tax=Intestinibaculum porci TaxID=2487118 RepID=UPI0024094B26|nr:DMT family transporter [Intestinibaculum porci]MDD6350708.1 DMT family transporter [Intestinibaculum porci]
MERKGMFYSIASAVIFGFMPLLTKVAYQGGANAVTAASSRYLMGSLILLTILKITKTRLKITKEEGKALLRLSIFMALTPLLLYSSYQYIDSGLSTTLHFTYPVFVILLSLILYKNKMRHKQSLATLLCMSGILCLYNPSGQISLFGMAIALASGLAYAFYILFLGRSHLDRLPTLTTAFYITLLSGLELLIFALLTGTFVYRLTPTAYVAEAALGLLMSVIALTFFQKGVFLCGDVKASLLSTFEPITSTFVGMLFLGERLTPLAYVGMICILISTIILVLPDRLRVREA